MMSYEIPRLTNHGTVIGMTMTEISGVSHEAGTTKFRADTGNEGIVNGSETASANETAGANE